MLEKGNTVDNGLMKIIVSTTLTNPDLEGIRGFTISGSNFDEFFPAFTTLNAAEDEISFIVRKSLCQTLLVI